MLIFCGLTHWILTRLLYYWTYDTGIIFSLCDCIYMLSYYVCIFIVPLLCGFGGYFSSYLSCLPVYLLFLCLLFFYFTVCCVHFSTNNHLF